MPLFLLIIALVFSKSTGKSTSYEHSCLIYQSFHRQWRPSRQCQHLAPWCCGLWCAGAHGAALLGSTAPGAGPSSRHTSLSLLYIEGYRGGWYCWRSKLYLVAHKMRIVPLSVSTVFHLITNSITSLLSCHPSNYSITHCFSIL